MMAEYSKNLGDVIRAARKKAELTQSEVADRIDIDVRTIINIENYKGNPKMEILFPLVRTLAIDPRDIFYPEVHEHGSATQRLLMLLSECSEKDVEDLMSICELMIKVMKGDTESAINAEND